MLVYHIADGDYISRPGQVLTLSNDFPYDWYTPEIRELCIDLFGGEGVAHFGVCWLNSFPIVHRCAGLTNALIELCFEAVRRKHFPHLPSRFQSLFVCISKENVEFWRTFVSTLSPTFNGMMKLNPKFF